MICDDVRKFFVEVGYRARGEGDKIWCIYFVIGLVRFNLNLYFLYF